MRWRALTALLLAMFLTAVLPLAGMAAAGRGVWDYLVFPPRTEHVQHAPFSWSAFLLFSLPALAACALYAVAFTRGRVVGGAPTRRRFPWWGWAGLGLVACGWILAWSGGLVAPEWRRHTFTPLWLGYAIVMNALAHRSGGLAPVVHRRAWFLALFPLSAAFWWLFEHLNQFARNWHYEGVAAASDWDYFLQATLPFATVLPEVASTLAWLRTFPRIEALRLPPVRGNGALAWGAITAGALALAFLGLRPEELFPFVWIAPMLLLVGLQRVLLGATLLAPLARGDWRPLLQPALAGLVCGIFWELWNWGSLAQWRYSIPYVERFRLFEMPLLGYAGYLPFGLTCALVLDLMGRITEGAPS